MRPGLKTLIGRCCCLLVLATSAWAHEERTVVIVDTDMGLDDLRALVLLLYSPDVRVEAVVTSDGSSSPEAGYENVQRLLAHFGARGTPVGKGDALQVPPPRWREQSENTGWSRERLERPGKSVKPAADAPKATEVIRQAVAKRGDALSYVCLGPLTNLAAALKAIPDLPKQIPNVYFYGTGPSSEPDWNRARDPDSYEAVAKAEWNLFTFALPADSQMCFDEGFLGAVRQLDTRAAQFIAATHEDARVMKLVREGHLRMWDETVALYLNKPSLGEVRKPEGKPRIFELARWDSQEARRHYLRLLSAMDLNLPVRHTVVLETFPTAPALFRPDVQPFVGDIIQRHGEEEWKAALLTNELHRHLGIYSIIGAKMGTRAREFFHASLDDLRVESHTGLKPPLSCLNDGLQAATGASLGRGTIQVRTEEPFAPEAVFSRQERRLTLTLKDEVAARIRRDIGSAIQAHGNLTPAYFAEVRRLSLLYWRDLNRDKIFEEVWMPDRQNE